MVKANMDQAPGFTLVELIIALAMMALVSVLLLSGLNLSTRTMESVNTQTGASEELRTVQGFLRAQVSQAYPISATRPSGSKRMLFDGQSDRLDFMAPLPAPWGAGGLYRISLYLERDGKARSLMISWDSNSQEFSRASDSPRATTSVLLPGVKDLRFDYLSSKDTRGRALWSTSWEDQTTLPSLIKVNIEFEEGTKTWPALIIAPRIDADAACAYDPISRRCRRET